VLFDKIATVYTILFEKYVYISALEMASPWNQHCANKGLKCADTVGTVPVPGSLTSLLNSMQSKARQ